ncbi:MAG: hypothetical protein JSU86_20095 [Phycisphaerales bacterium]|nr:MAG: hypothetical protein JSU86_20095 [Phycisphaerales bacterium]
MGAVVMALGRPGPAMTAPEKPDPDAGKGVSAAAPGGGVPRQVPATSGVSVQGHSEPRTVCGIVGASNCQLLDTGDNQVLTSDLTVPPSGVTHADDFVPVADTITQICVWGAYVDPSAPSASGPVGWEEYDCTGHVEDDFRVRIYDDGGGLPGALVAERSVTGGDITRAHEPGTDFEGWTGIPMQAYVLALNPAITLPAASVTYWLEVANNTDTLAGEVDPTRNRCYWHWARTTPAGNVYCAGGTDDRESAGDGYPLGSAKSADLAFCLGGTSGGLDFDPPPAAPGGCCECGTHTCNAGWVFETCAAPGVFWDLTNSECGGACVDPPWDDCATDTKSISDGLYAFDSSCATRDGPGFPAGPGSAFGADLWFAYTATCTGRLIASLCATGLQYDSWVAVYHDDGNPTVCPCPGDSTAFQVDHSDEGCNGIYDGGPGLLDSIVTFPGWCWLIRVGGYHTDDPDLAARGRGFLDVACETVACFPSYAPEPELMPNITNDLVAGTKNRFLSFSAGLTSRQQAVRVTFTDLPEPYHTWNGTEMWVGQPQEVTETAGSSGSSPPPTFWAATLQCDPYYTDWTAYETVHVHHEGVVPGATYTIDVIDDTCLMIADSFSPPLEVSTTRWGDPVGRFLSDEQVWSTPNDRVDMIEDVVAIIDKFRNEPSAPSKSRADVVGALPTEKLLNQIVDFNDITRSGQAFEGFPYPFTPGAAPCPGSRHGMRESFSNVQAPDERVPKVRNGAQMAQSIKTGAWALTESEIVEIPPGTPSRVFYNDGAKRAGRAAVASEPEAVVYRAIDYDPATYAYYVNYGPTTGAEFPGVFFADNMTLGNGFQPGDQITGYDLKVYRSSWDPWVGHLATIHVELWDGDPLGVYDTAANGYLGAVIAGTEADFTGIPVAEIGETQVLRAELSAPVVIPHERVWMVVTSDACRLGWLRSFVKPTVGTDEPDDVWEWQLDNDGGFNGAGVCCYDGSACDVDGPDNDIETIGDNVYCDAGVGDPDGTKRWCSDNHAEGAGVGGAGGPCTGNDATDNCTTFVASIYGQARTTISLVPIGNDADGNLDPDVVIEGNEITMPAGARDVFFEVRIGDWDPEDTGTKLKAFQATLDSSGYTSGVQGTLTAKAVPCAGDQQCIDAFGAGGSTCAFPIAGPAANTYCEPGFQTISRTDYVYSGESALSAVDLSTPDFRYGAAHVLSSIDDPVPFPADGMYAGTLVVEVPADAAGRFTLGFDAAAGGLVDQSSARIPLVGFAPATIVIDRGQCCNMSADPPVCVDDTVTAAECDALGSAGGYEVHHDASKTCADDCPPDCNNNAVPDDQDISGVTSDDCNSNEIPDECEIPVSSGGLCTVDCDPDCNENGIPDECDTDCNDNGIPDDCDIAGPTSDDCNSNEIPDECEIPVGSGGLCTVDCDPDCNTNGVPDECDITGPTSVDCDADDIPDECELPVSSGGLCIVDCDPDCNANGVLDECDIAGPTSDDCIGNGIPDECELPISSGGLCTVDCDPDCNTNAFPDECDIAECSSSHPDYPGCDDCNLNEVPDECDIAGPTSDDVDLDEVPDECAEYTGGGATNDWSDPDNWDLPGETIPDNVGEATYSVTIGDDGAAAAGAVAGLVSVDVDIDVDVDSLRIFNNGKLRVVGDTVGDLTAVAAGGILNKGFLVVNNSRQINVTSGSVRPASGRQTGGPLTIGPCGSYEADETPENAGCSGDLMCASLSAGSVTILPADCDTCFVGGRMILEEAMSVGVTGDIVLQGSPTPTCPGWSRRNGEDLTLRGITPPPKLWTGAQSDVAVGTAVRAAATAEPRSVGNFIMTGAVETTNTSAVGMALAGDFDNRSTYPSLFHWDNGRLRLNGTDSQTFEVAGLDLGPVAEGFDTNQDTLFDTEHHTNYTIGTIIVEGAPGSPPQVTFVNSFANTAGADPCDEALYVDTLTLQAGSTIALDNCRVYYRNLVDNGADIQSTGCGELVDLCSFNPPTAAPGEAGYEKVRYISIVSDNPDRGTALQVTFSDLAAPYASWNGVKMWVQEPTVYCENAGKKTPPCPAAQPITEFMGATLGCDPWVGDFYSAGVIHVFHEGIIPDSVYEVRAADAACSLTDEGSYSTPLVLPMSVWGDVVRNCTTCPCGAPDGTVGIPTDVTAVLDKFKNLVPPSLPCAAVTKVRADLEPQIPDQVINITDVTYTLDAFRGFGYPPDPFPDPSPPPCGGRATAPGH